MLGLLKKFENKYCIKHFAKLKFKPGDTVIVSTSVLDGGKTKIQKFKGVVMQRRHKGSAGETFTVYKLSNNIKVEKIFSINSPNIISIETVNYGVVRRAKLFYLRTAKGKNLKIKNKIINKNNSKGISSDTNTSVPTENIDNSENSSEDISNLSSTSNTDFENNTSKTSIKSDYSSISKDKM